MKKKIFNILLIAIFSILILETKVNASNIVSTDKQVNSGDGNVTISITSKETLGAYNLELVDNSGLELVSSSAGSSGTANGAKISGASATGITDLGSYTFKVPTVTSDTTYKIKFRITGMANVNDEDLPNVDNNAILTVKAPKTEAPTENNNTNNNTSNNAGSSNNNSSNNNSTTKSSEARLRDLGLNPKQYDFKGFKSDTYQYNVEVPNEAEKVYIYATTKDSNAKVKSGDGNITLNEGENKVEIVVVAEDGKTKKTYTLNITRKVGEQTTTPVEEPVIDEQPQTDSTTASTAEETSSATISENAKITTSTTKTESTSTKSEKQQIVGKVNWLKPETWGQEQYILVAVLAFLILTIIASIILKIKIKKDEEEEIEFPGAEELDRAMFEHQELSDNGNIDDNYYNDDMNDENPYSTNFNDDYYNDDNSQYNEEQRNAQPVEVEYKEENTSNDYNANVSEKNDEDIERKRMLEEYFAGQDGKDTKVKRTKTKGKHF